MVESGMVESDMVDVEAPRGSAQRQDRPDFDAEAGAAKPHPAAAAAAAANAAGGATAAAAGVAVAAEVAADDDTPNATGAADGDRSGGRWNVGRKEIIVAGGSVSFNRRIYTAVYHGIDFSRATIPYHPWVGTC